MEQKYTHTNNNEWTQLFKSISKLCKEPKLREFHFKLLHRIVVTRNDLCKYRRKPDSDFIYCGEEDSLEHTFMNCSFTKTLFARILDWFNEKYKCTFDPSEKKMLFGINGNPKAVRRLNFTLLSMKYHIYSRKLEEKSLSLEELARKINWKLKVEKLASQGS